MTFAVWIPLAGNILLALALPALDRTLPCRVRPAALALLAAVAAGSWLWSLGLLTAAFVDRVPYLSALGGPRADPRALSHGPPLAVSGGAVLLLVAVAVRLAPVAAGQVAELVRAERLARLGPRAGVVVLADPVPYACAVGGISGGRIAITSGMRRCLTAREQAAVLAHERAHLAGRHHVLRIVVVCCAAASPFLLRLPARLETACERAADEHAARAVGDRRIVARALDKAALAALRARADKAGPPGGDAAGPLAVAPAFHEGSVAERMEALLGSPVRPRPASALAAAVLIGASCSVVIASALHAGTDYYALLC